MSPRSGTQGTGTAGRLRRDRILDRRRRVESLALERVSVRELARRLGVPATTVQRDLVAVRDDWRTAALESRGERVARELAALDADERTLRGGMNRARRLARTADPGEARAALETSARLYDRVLRIMERRAALLGLDAPARAEVSCETRVEVSPIVLAARRDPRIRALLDDVAAAMYAPPPEPAEGLEVVVPVQPEASR